MAGLWGTAFDATNEVSLYPIIEFTSDGGNPRFRGWNNGVYVDMGLPVGFTYNSWYSLSIRLVGSNVIYSVGNLSATVPAEGSTTIGNMILQGHNTASPGVTYDIYWDNFKSAGVKLPFSATPVTITASQYSAEGGSATDNCVNPVINYKDSKAGTCPIVVTRVFTIADACGNTSTKTQLITIDDNTAPTLTGTAYTGTTGTDACISDAETAAPFDALNAKNGYSDNCGGAVTAELTNTVVTGDNCSWKVTYTFNVKDVCGNILANQSYFNTGGDKTAPALTGTWPANIAGVNNCAANVPDEPTDAVIALLYTDACGGDITAAHTKTADPLNTNCSWSYTYEYTIKDACNNVVLPKPVFTISGGDLTAPTLTGTAYAGTTGTNSCKADAETAAPFNAANAIWGYTDNCGE